MDVERLAISHIDSLLGHCPRLTSYINSNDKTPFTDGHIEMYSNEAKTNDAAIGRVDVQVKGREVKSKKKTPLTYRVEVSDLRAYLNFSGVLYLVVNVNSTTHRSDAFYALLSPFRIDEVLRQMKPRQKSVAVTLKPFPTGPDEIEELVRFALKTRVQNPKQGIDPILFPAITDLTIHGIGKIDLNKPVKFNISKDDYAIFARTQSGMEIPLPGKAILVPHEYVGEPFECTIGSGDVVFENPTRRRLDDNTVEFQLSDNLKFTLPLPGSGRSGSLTLQSAARFDHRLQDIDFYLACIDTGKIRLDSTTAVISIHTPGNVDDLREHRKHLQRLHELFQSLAVPESLINLPEITEERSAQLDYLHRSLVIGETLNLEHQTHGRVFQPVGGYGLELMTIEQSDGWRIADTFAPELPYQFASETESDNGESRWQAITPYELLDARQIARTLNLHLPFIVSAYEAIQLHENVDTLANLTVLRLIQAADLDQGRTAELLDAAMALNDWLISRTGDEAHHVINRVQIHSRLRDLTAEERHTLREIRRAAIRENDDRSLQVELSCSVLLGESDEVTGAVNRMQPEALETFKTWPIWNLAEPGRQVPHEISSQETAAKFWIRRAFEGDW